MKQKCDNISYTVCIPDPHLHVYSSEELGCPSHSVQVHRAGEVRGALARGGPAHGPARGAG